VARYTSAGDLDNTFGDLVSGSVRTGKTTTDFGTSSDWAHGLALQADGKIVVAGESGGNFALARYATDGTLDNSFDGDGKLVTNLGGPDGFGHAVRVHA